MFPRKNTDFAYTNIDSATNFPWIFIVKFIIIIIYGITVRKIRTVYLWTNLSFFLHIFGKKVTPNNLVHIKSRWAIHIFKKSFRQNIPWQDFVGITSIPKFALRTN